MFPSFCWGGSLPAVASVFTAELSAIVLALRTIFTLLVNSFVIFSDSRSVLSALNSSIPFIHPLVYPHLSGCIYSATGDIVLGSVGCRATLACPGTNGLIG